MPACAVACDRASNVHNLWPNVPLVIISVCQRMSNIFHTLAYACAIRNRVTGPLRIHSKGALGQEYNALTERKTGSFD